MQDMSEPEPETESESKTEWDPTTLTAPEFQILTPSFFVAYLNTMSSLVEVGVSTQSYGGQAFGVGVSALRSVKPVSFSELPRVSSAD